jgi:hypothetical protein
MNGYTVDLTANSGDLKFKYFVLSCGCRGILGDANSLVCCNAHLVEYSDFADDDWVKNHWGGWSHLMLRNEDFMLDFKDGCLWLHFESIGGDSIGRLLLKRDATKDDIIAAEKFFGVGDVS